jgi:hypothetical protein
MELGGSLTAAPKAQQKGGEQNGKECEERHRLAKVAYAYTEKHVGPRECVGNKDGTLGNRLRALLVEKK